MDLSSSPGPRGRVLYIEDNQTNIRLMQSWADQFPDLELLIAETGAAGLLANERERPDAILLDLNLPDMPGSEVLRRLRLQPMMGSVPIAVLSGHTAAEHVQDAVRGGAVAYWTKPVDLLRLAQDLADLLTQTPDA
nr:response regulator [uncultured Roseateles sp.]